MNNSQHTSITLSKLIHKRLPELETEKWHWWDKVGGTYRGIHAESPNNPKGGWEFAPAYTFTDLFLVIKMLGEKEEWDNLSPLPNEANRRIDRKSQELLQQFIMRDGYTIGENTERYLTKLLTK